MTEGRHVRVIDTWTDGDRAVCVVYEAPHVSGVIGLRVTTDLPRSGFPRNAQDLGQDMADFSIGEPLGAVSDGLRVDADGVQWWGQLLAELPRRDA